MVRMSHQSSIHLDDSITCLYTSPHGCSIFFYRLYEDGIVSTDRQPKSIVIFLDDHTTLNKTIYLGSTLL